MVEAFFFDENPHWKPGAILTKGAHTWIPCVIPSKLLALADGLSSENNGHGVACHDPAMAFTVGVAAKHHTEHILWTKIRQQIFATVKLQWILFDKLKEPTSDNNPIFGSVARSCLVTRMVHQPEQRTALGRIYRVLGKTREGLLLAKVCGKWFKWGKKTLSQRHNGGGPTERKRGTEQRPQEGGVPGCRLVTKKWSGFSFASAVRKNNVYINVFAHSSGTISNISNM